MTGTTRVRAERARDEPARRSGCASVEQARCPVEDGGVEMVDVAAHRGGGVGVAEDLLDVEQVEAVRTGLVDVTVHEAGCGAAEVVGSDVAECGLVGSAGDDFEDGPSGSCRGEASAPVDAVVQVGDLLVDAGGAGTEQVRTGGTRPSCCGRR